MPQTCIRRAALDPEAYQKVGRFLALGAAYQQWITSDCYPPLLDDDALGGAAAPAGNRVSLGEREAFVVNLDPTWFARCTQTATPVAGSVPVTGAEILGLKAHLLSLADVSSLDLREIGLGEARLRDKRAIFALYLGTADRAAYLECFQDLDGAVERAIHELGGGAKSR